MTWLGLSVWIVSMYALGWPESFGKKLARIHKAYNRVMAGYSAKPAPPQKGGE